MTKNTLADTRINALAHQKTMLVLRKELQIEAANQAKELSTLAKDRKSILKEIDVLERMQQALKPSESKQSDVTVLADGLVFELGKLQLLDLKIAEIQSLLADTEALLSEVNTILAQLESSVKKADKVLEPRRARP